MTNSGAIRTIPERARTISINLFEVRPTGAFDRAEANRNLPCASAKLFISVLQKKNRSKARPTGLLIFLLRSAIMMCAAQNIAKSAFYASPYSMQVLLN
jgi:hypothetical protein